MSNYPTHDAISEASINLTSFHKAFGKGSRSEAIETAISTKADIRLNDKDFNNLNEVKGNQKKVTKKICKNFEGREKFLLRETHNIFQSATKINIGQSLIEHAMEACEMPPKDLLNAFMTGIPAFNSMWIEYDLSFGGSVHNPTELSGTSSKYQGPIRCGYLIQKVGWENLSQFDAEQFSPKEKAEVARQRRVKPVWTPMHRVTPMMGSESDWFELHKFIHRPEYEYEDCPDSEVFNPHKLIAPKCGAIFSYGEEENEFTGNIVSRETYLKQMAEKNATSILTQQYVDRYGGKKSQKAFLNGLFSRVGFCQHLFAPLVSDRYATNWQATYINFFRNASSDKWIDGHLWAMDLRFVIAVLGLLNYQREVERDIEIVDNDDIEKPLMLHEPINEVKVVEINLPKDEGVKLYGKIFKQCITRQRKHLRRGHWRTIHYKSGLIKRKWVEPYWAGDAKLGTIIHDYNLVNKKAG